MLRGSPESVVAFGLEGISVPFISWLAHSGFVIENKGNQIKTYQQAIHYSIACIKECMRMLNGRSKAKVIERKGGHEC